MRLQSCQHSRRCSRERLAALNQLSLYTTADLVFHSYYKTPKTLSKVVPIHSYGWNVAKLDAGLDVSNTRRQQPLPCPGVPSRRGLKPCPRAAA